MLAEIKHKQKLAVSTPGVYKDITDKIIVVLSGIGTCEKSSSRKIHIKKNESDIEVVVCEDGIDFMAITKKEVLDSSKDMCYPSNNKRIITSTYFLYYRDILDYENDILKALSISLGEDVFIDPTYLYYRQNDNDNEPVLRTKILRYSKSGNTIYTEDGNSWRINNNTKNPYIVMKGSVINIHGYTESYGYGYDEIYEAYLKQPIA